MMREEAHRSQANGLSTERTSANVLLSVVLVVCCSLGYFLVFSPIWPFSLVCGRFVPHESEKAIQARKSAKFASQALSVGAEMITFAFV